MTYNVFGGTLDPTLHSFPQDPNIQLGGLGSAVSSPAGYGESSSHKLDFVHFKRKIWHLVRIILVTFLKNYIDFLPSLAKHFP